MALGVETDRGLTRRRWQRRNVEQKVEGDPNVQPQVLQPADVAVVLKGVADFDRDRPVLSQENTDSGRLLKLLAGEIGEVAEIPTEGFWKEMGKEEYLTQEIADCAIFALQALVYIVPQGQVTLPQEITRRASTARNNYKGKTEPELRQILIEKQGTFLRANILAHDQILEELYETVCLAVLLCERRDKHWHKVVLEKLTRNNIKYPAAHFKGTTEQMGYRKRSDWSKLCFLLRIPPGGEIDQYLRQLPQVVISAILHSVKEAGVDDGTEEFYTVETEASPIASAIIWYLTQKARKWALYKKRKDNA